MLELRPNCEMCDKDLPPNSVAARICSYECTFCADCAAMLENVCPNCGGGLVPRPIRPQLEWRPKTSVSFDPPSSTRRHLKWPMEEIAVFVQKVASVPPDQR